MRRNSVTMLVGMFCMALGMLAYGQAQVFAPWEGAFAGKLGGIPEGWRAVRQVAPGTGLTKTYSWEGQPGFRIKSGQEDVIIQTAKYEYPQEGYIRFTVWARATKKTARISIFVIGDGYNSLHWQKTTLDESFKPVTVTHKIPTTFKKNRLFWLRIDAPKENNDLVVGKVKTEILGPDAFQKKKPLPKTTAFTPWEETFAGQEGTMPAKWHAVRKAASGTGLTAAGSWEGKPAFRIVAGKETVIVHSQKFEFPAKGTLKLTVWARANKGKADMNLYIIGDNYKALSRKHAVLTDKFQEVTVELPVPATIQKSKLFWFRIDALNAGSDLLIGKVRTALLESK